MDPSRQEKTYPGQEVRTLYAQKIRSGPRRRRSTGRSRGGSRQMRLLLWGGALLALVLLLRLI